MHHIRSPQVSIVDERGRCRVGVMTAWANGQDSVLRFDDVAVTAD